MKRGFFFVIALAVSQPLAAVNCVSEAFGNVANLGGVGWVMINHSQPLGTTNWFQGNTAVLPAQAGDPNSYIAADYNNASLTGTISNWLLTPVTALETGAQLTFYTRTVVGSPFADRMQVRMSLAGASTDVGTTALDVGDFSTLLLDINPSYAIGGYPQAWTQFTVTLSGIATPTTGRLAYRYFVEDGGPSGNRSTYIGIDTHEFCSATATATVSGDAAICAGASANISAALAGTAPWNLTWSDGFVQNGVAASPATRSVSPAATTTYTVTTISDAVGPGLAFGSATITVNPIPATPAISTAQSIPPASLGSASVTDHAGSTYAWTLTPGGIMTGQGTSSITFVSGTPGTRMTLTVSETNSGCTSAVASKHAMVDFSDVPPSHIFHDFIIKLANNGITAGCGNGNYCPNDSVLRSQMAIFLLRGEHGETYAPPTATGIFADVPTPSIFADFIEQLFNEGISGGCATNPLRYCPGNPVLRSQMAIFLLRAEHGAAYNPPPASGIFQDVPPGSFGANFIEQLSVEGITGGCSANPPLYCPNTATTRGAMAVFLVRTFNLQ